MSLHSILELRNCLTNGAVLLDIAGDDINMVIESFLENVIRLGYLDESKRYLVKNLLLLKHVHQHEKEFHDTKIKERKAFPLIKSFADMRERISHVDLQSFNKKSACLPSPHSTGNIRNNVCCGSTDSRLEMNTLPFKKTDSKAKVNVFVSRYIS